MIKIIISMSFQNPFESKFIKGQKVVIQGSIYDDYNAIIIDAILVANKFEEIGSFFYRYRVKLINFYNWPEKESYYNGRVVIMHEDRLKLNVNG
jgi:hypothetical protein